MPIQFLNLTFLSSFKSLCFVRTNAPKPRQLSEKSAINHVSGSSSPLSSTSSNGGLAEIPQAAGSELGLFLWEILDMPQPEGRSWFPRISRFRLRKQKREIQRQRRDSGKETGASVSPRFKIRHP